MGTGRAFKNEDDVPPGRRPAERAVVVGQIDDAMVHLHDYESLRVLPGAYLQKLSNDLLDAQRNVVKWLVVRVKQSHSKEKSKRIEAALERGQLDSAVQMALELDA